MNITEYDEVRAKLEEVKDVCDFIPDASTDEGYKKSKSVALDVGRLLTALEKARKAKKAYFIDGGKEVDIQAKSIKQELEAFQLPHKEAYKELDNLKKEREAARKQELEDRVAQIRDLPDQMRDASSDEVKMALESLQQEECLDFYEYATPALKARNESRTALATMFGDKLKAEDEARELDKLRAEKEAREKADHEESIRREAAAKAEEEKADAIKREKLAKEEAANANYAADMARLNAEDQKKRLEKRIAEDNRIAAENAAQAKRQAKINEDMAAKNSRLKEVARQKEVKRLEQVEADKREADKKHVGNIRREAKEALMALGLSEKQSKDVVLAINSGDVPHVKITY